MPDGVFLYEGPAPKDKPVDGKVHSMDWEVVESLVTRTMTIVATQTAAEGRGRERRKSQESIVWILNVDRRFFWHNVSFETP